MTRFATGVVVFGLMGLSLTACPDNQFKASTWTKKLTDQREAERAVDKLEQLGDPSAIEALGHAWESQGKPVRFLQVMIGLARPLTPEQAKSLFLTDYEEGRTEHWNDALPFLQKAVSEVDDSNPRSVDSAQKAADAIGEAKLAAGMPQLIELAQKPTTKKLIAAQVAAVRAIGKMDGDKSQASAALIKLVEREPPAHPKTAKDKETGRALEEKYGLFLGVTGSAINALGDLRISAATKPLILQMYRTPELFMQIRRALVASGPSAVDELGKVLRNQSTEVNQLFSQLKLDEYRGDKGDAPSAAKVSAKDFYPAVVLGDFYDNKSVKDLLAALDLEGRPPLPVYYINDNPSPNTQYNAIFDSLRKIGSAEAEPAVRKLWSTGPAAVAPPKGKKGPEPSGGGAEARETARVLAIGAYPFLARDSSAASELAKIADSPGDNQIRQEAATAFARLSTNAEDIKVLNRMAKVQFDASQKQKDFAAKEKAKADAADAVYEGQKKAVAAAKADALKATHDPSKNADAIKAVVKTAKDLEDKLKGEQKKAHSEAVGAYKGAVQASGDLDRFGRLFETHIARIVVAIRCKADLNCFAKTLTMKPDDAIKDVQPYVTVDIAKSWPKEEKQGLVEAEVERAMLEIGKKGAAASSLTDTLLDAAKSDNRLIRQSVLLALPKIAKVPCGNCEAKLDVAIKAGEGKTTLGDLNLETTMLRNYFSWAGGKTPSAPGAAVPSAPAPAAPAEAPAPTTPEKAETPPPAPAPTPAPTKATPAPTKPPTKPPAPVKKKGH